jgi:hypothetical protein
MAGAGAWWPGRMPDAAEGLRFVMTLKLISIRGIIP